MQDCFFVSDLHGSTDRYQKLFATIAAERPGAVFIGGDILPTHLSALTAPVEAEKFISGFLAPEFDKLRASLGREYPRILIILGNDDARSFETDLFDGAARGLWEYLHDRKKTLGPYSLYGYAYVPPTPFRLKDWERYDVSRYVDPGCVSPEAGGRTVPVSDHEKKYSTIQADLVKLSGEDDLSRALFLFHSPPHDTKLDRAALDGKMIDHVPLDVHIGSIAIRRFIESRQPLVTLHGHVHESASITGSWRDRIGRTHLFSAAHDGPELSLIRFSLEKPAAAHRELL